jgi:prepilin-type N-terminal cleavage/methylation domain-containing protein
VHRRPRAFTLIETMLVIALLGVLAMAAVVKLWEPLRSSRSEDVLRRLQAADETTRQSSRRSNGVAVVVYDLDRGLLLRTGSAGGEGDIVMRLPEGYRLETVRLAGRTSASGDVAIEYRDGRSPSYAVEVVGPDRSSRWLVFAGLTGQLTRLTDEREVEALFAALSPASDDAG